MIELFSANTPNAWKISIMLEEIGYEYKVSPVDIYNKEQFKDEFLSSDSGKKFINRVIVSNDLNENHL